jgi:plastocyanin
MRRLPAISIGLIACLTFSVVACGAGADLPALATAAAGATPASSFNVVAKGIKFDTDTLVVAANQEVVISLDNEDGASHNISVYSKEGGEAIYRGALFQGVETREYRFQAPPTGVYYFHCDAHPDMEGVFISR